MKKLRVVISGEPGSGKTRLLEVINRAVERAGYRVDIEDDDKPVSGKAGPHDTHHVHISTRNH